MIAIPKPLSKPERKALAEMLLSQPFKDLMRVISAKADTKQLEVMSDSERGEDEGSNRQLSAQQAKQDLAGYRAFLKVVNEEIRVASSDQNFNTVEIQSTQP